MAGHPSPAPQPLVYTLPHVPAPEFTPEGFRLGLKFPAGFIVVFGHGFLLNSLLRVFVLGERFFLGSLLRVFVVLVLGIHSLWFSSWVKGSCWIYSSGFSPPVKGFC